MNNGLFMLLCVRCYASTLQTYTKKMNQARVLSKTYGLSIILFVIFTF